MRHEAQKMGCLSILLGLLILQQNYQLWISPQGIAYKNKLVSYYQKQQAKNMQLSQRNDALAYEVSQIKQNPQVINTLLRYQLMLKKKHEHSFQWPA